ncbi:MAG TPA: membrane protein insertion efficiency factor YidD [Candidatus Brocadiaceae bacterium]|nr:membrane protein insertion efficiency factor YidD [Candidatus Brocadiaceae bacterium]
MKFIIIALVHAYRFIISPVLPHSCRYNPTCSQYMLDAVKKKGIIKGTFLGVWRVLRCNPWGGSGYDPVD